MKPLWLAGLAALSVAVFGADEPRRNGKKGGEKGSRVETRMPTPAFRTEVPEHPYDLILGRPTDRAITASLLAYESLEGFLSYRREGEPTERRSPTRPLVKGEPAEVLLEGLEPGTHYAYRLHTRRVGAVDFSASEEFAFTTARPRGSEFTFTVQADPHLDFGIDPPTYVKSLRHAVAAGTDFHVDLGDTFMTDKYPHFKDAFPQYLAQRYYFGLVGTRAPVFLVLGNHDGEQPARGGGSDGESMAVWSARMRTRYFPNPVPNHFYTGNPVPDPQVGPLQNYYAWEWGDALFVALDPFWFSPRGARGDNWSRTLGRAQYDWLKATLERSRAPFKFIFIHHLVGGATPEGRGGAEAAAFFEWGGRDLNGEEQFARRRPGWPAPIHALLVQNRVSIVFHGHDHIYAYQERDGIVYQLVPQPGHSRVDTTRTAEEYSYRSGVIQGASGILQVNVTSTSAKVEYVRAYPDALESATKRSGSISHQYEVRAR